MGERLHSLRLSKKDLGKAGLPTVAFLQLLSAACGNSSSGTITPDQASSSPKPSAGNKFDLPFSEQYYSDMHIQTGYKHQNGSVHGGLDYILGEIDKSATWKSFQVLATADGKACIPEDRQGNAVLIRHFGMVDTVSSILKKQVQYVDTYSGHLAKYLVDGLSSCKTAISTWIDVKKGQVIGEAGSTGVKDDNRVDQPSWVHVHSGYNVLISGESVETHVDPYGLYTTRETYPNPNSAKGKCGPQNLLNICGGNAVDLVKAATTTSSTTSTIPTLMAIYHQCDTRKEVPTATATPDKHPDKPIEFTQEIWDRLSSNRQIAFADEIKRIKERADATLSPDKPSGISQESWDKLSLEQKITLTAEMRILTQATKLEDELKIAQDKPRLLEEQNCRQALDAKTPKATINLTSDDEVRVSANASSAIQARAKALGYWLKLFSSKQDAPYNYVTFSPQIADLNSWKTSLAQVAESNIPTSRPMTVTWWLSNAINQISRYSGEVLINNIHIISADSRPLTQADQANQISFDGPIRLGFISSHRLSRETASYLNYNYDATVKWFTQPLPPLPNTFSDWKDETWTINLISQRGQWGQTGILKSNTNPFLETFLPSKAFLAFNEDRNCRNTASTTYCPPVIQRGGLP